MTLAERIKRARTERKVGREKLAARIGYTSTTIKRWEAGEHEPRVSDVERLADELDVPCEWLALGHGPDPFAEAA